MLDNLTNWQQIAADFRIEFVIFSGDSCVLVCVSNSNGMFAQVDS